MAYSASGLHRMAGASGVQLWIYQTTDAIAAINTSGYFNDAANMMNVRDLIIVKQKNNIDKRGTLREIFNNKILKKKFVFEYCTTSKKNVLRGFHFHTKFAS